MNRLFDLAPSTVDRVSARYATDARVLSAVRILFALHVLLFPIDYTWVAQVPSAFFQPPPGPFSVLGGPPSLAFIVGLQVVRAVLAVAVLVGFRTAAASILLSLVLITGSGLTHSFGKVDHFILYELLPLFMAFAGWGVRYSLDAKLGKPRKPSGYAMFLWAITVGYALFSAAVPKVLTGWLDPTREATRGYIARDLADPVKLGPLAEQIFAIDSPLFWKFLDYATVVAEAGLLFAVLVPFVYRLGVLVLFAFHAGVYFTLGIDFAHYFFVYAVFFFPVGGNWLGWPIKAALAGYRSTNSSRR